jgi:putative acyl-CoA dehydrogenase
MSKFFQTPPTLLNQYEEDPVLSSYLKRVLPTETLNEIEPDLVAMGERTINDLMKLSERAEKQKPVHVPYDAWGNRIDQIETSPEWKEFDRISAEEKLVAIGYERKQGVYSRIYQFAKLYLFHPSSAIYTCPLAMTDGAARAIELYGDDHLKATAFKHLTSSDPKTFWTSGQWMTERTGGSDVATTSTEAKLENGKYHLYGTKWFTSATTSQMALTLARTPGAPAGGRGLSLFFVKLRDEDGTLNQIQVNRLKDKLGTWALPTAELDLQGTPAILLGEEGNGIKKFSSLFNITRIYNACCAIANMRRGIALAQSYAQNRIAFGKPLIEHDLHVETLAELEVQFEACFLLTFRTIELLGKEELGNATPEESALLRLLTPITKLFTAKHAVSNSSEVLESFGGAGYVEDTGLPRLLRDSQVLAIWEGTTNVLSLDMLRALEKEQALEPFFNDLADKIKNVSSKELSKLADFVQEDAKNAESSLVAILSSSQEDQRAVARDISFTLAHLYTAALLIEHADWALKVENSSRFAVVAARWCERKLVILKTSNQVRRNQSKSILQKE